MKKSSKEELNQDVFDLKVLTSNSKDNEIAEIMTNVIESLTDRDFVKYFTVGVGNALDIFEDEISELNPVVRPIGDAAEDEPKKTKKVELGITIMKCQPSSRNYCEATTRDLFRLFQCYFLPQKKYGSISNFVCEFIQGKNGIIYFNQVKAFESDYKLHGEDVRALNTKIAAEQSWRHFTAGLGAPSVRPGEQTQGTLEDLAKLPRKSIIMLTQE